MPLVRPEHGEGGVIGCAVVGRVLPGDLLGADEEPRCQQARLAKSITFGVTAVYVIKLGVRGLKTHAMLVFTSIVGLIFCPRHVAEWLRVDVAPVSLFAVVRRAHPCVVTADDCSDLVVIGG